MPQASQVKKIIGDDVKIKYIESNDNRSYHINSDKIKNLLNYSPKRTIENAVEDLCEAFKKGLLSDSFTEDIYFNINRMKNIKAK